MAESTAERLTEIQLSCKSDFEEFVHSNAETCWSVVTIQAPQCQEDESGEVTESGRSPLELVAVIDKSGSMSSSGKLTMVKETMLFVIQQLSSKDKLGVVMYDTHVTSTGSLKSMDEKGKAEMTSLIERLSTGSCTNLSGGLIEGLAMIEDLQKSQREAATGEDTAAVGKKTVASVLLMTDGVANEGLTSVHDIVKCLTQRGRHDFYPDGGYRAGSLGGGRRRPQNRMRSAPPPMQQQQAPAPRRGVLSSVLQSINPFASTSSSTSSAAPPPPVAQTNVIDPIQIPQQQQQQALPYGDPQLAQQLQLAPDLQQQQVAPPPPAPPSQVNMPPPPPDMPEPSAAGPNDLSDQIAASVYTFGFGADHNAELLQALSDAGNGVYYFLDSSEKIPESFGDCLGGLLSTAAQNISVEVIAENGCSIKQAFAGRSTQSKGSGQTVTFSLGDIQSEERRDCVITLDLPVLGEEVMEVTVLRAKMTCFNVITGMLETKEVELKLRRVKSVPAKREPNEDVDEHRNRIVSAQVMESATALADQGDLTSAKSMLMQQQMCIRSSASKATPVSTELDRDMDRMAEGLASSAAWHHGGKHLSSNIAQKHICQRSNDVMESGYGNRMKMKKKAEFSKR